jgi:hypothetical protein
MATKESAGGSVFLQWWNRRSPSRRALPLRQRIVAATLGVACAVLLFVAAVPSAHSTASSRPGSGSSLSYLLLDALRMLTGVAAADLDPAEASAHPSGGIRN